MSLFDKVHTSSHSTLMETMHLSLPSSNYSELFVKSRLFNLPHLHLAPREGDRIRIAPKSLASEKKYIPLASCGVFCVILSLTIWHNAGVWQTNAQTPTHRHTTTAYTALAYRRTVKTATV